MKPPDVAAICLCFSLPVSSLTSRRQVTFAQKAKRAQVWREHPSILAVMRSRLSLECTSNRRQVLHVSFCWGKNEHENVRVFLLLKNLKRERKWIFLKTDFHSAKMKTRHEIAWCSSILVNFRCFFTKCLLVLFSFFVECVYEREKERIKQSK